MRKEADELVLMKAQGKQEERKARLGGRLAYVGEG